MANILSRVIVASLPKSTDVAFAILGGVTHGSNGRMVLVGDADALAIAQSIIEAVKMHKVSTLTIKMGKIEREIAVLLDSLPKLPNSPKASIFTADELEGKNKA